ncbi:Teneurin-4, partial [Saguinus oedipus]
MHLFGLNWHLQPMEGQMYEITEDTASSWPVPTDVSLYPSGGTGLETPDRKGKGTAEGWHYTWSEYLFMISEMKILRAKVNSWPLVIFKGNVNVVLGAHQVEANMTSKGDEQAVSFSPSTAPSLTLWWDLETTGKPSSFFPDDSFIDSGEIDVGRRASQKIPPGTFWRSQVFIDHPVHLKFNVSLGKAALFDFVELLDGRRLLTQEARSLEGTPRQSRGAVPPSSHETGFIQYLDSGIWHLAFYNDGKESEVVSFLTTAIDVPGAGHETLLTGPAAQGIARHSELAPEPRAVAHCFSPTVWLVCGAFQDGGGIVRQESWTSHTEATSLFLALLSHMF